MYAVSDAFKKAIQDNTRRYHWTGKIITTEGKEYAFSNREIVKGSGYITNQCCGSSDIEIGCVYAAEFGISLYANINRYSLEKGIIELSFHLEIAPGMFETVPMGVYEICEANRVGECLEIKAYDYMLRFDKAWKDTVTSGTAYELLTMACEACQVTLAHSKEELDTFPNSQFTLGVYQENDIETWRDLLYYVAQVLGSFATMNREGKLELRRYGTVSTETIASNERFDSSFSDFITRYTAISSTNVKIQKSEYYSLDPDDGLTMNLAVNPLLQHGLAQIRKTILETILSEVAKIHYVPFDSTTIGNPALDLGDVLTFTGGQADETKQTVITSYTYRINGKHSLKCVGKNPRLSEAKSKNDKNIAGLLNSVESSKVAVHTYTNAKTHTIRSGLTEIVYLEFLVVDTTVAQFHAMFLFEIAATPVTKTITIASTNEEISWQEDGMASLEVLFYVDGLKVESYVPKEHWSSGQHMLTLYYPLTSLEINKYHTFQVYLSMQDGHGTIAPGQIKASLSGQGISSQLAEWNGRLQIEDRIPRVILSPVRVRTMKDRALVKRQLPIPTPIEQVLIKVGVSTIMLPALQEHDIGFVLYQPNQPIDERMTRVKLKGIKVERKLL